MKKLIMAAFIVLTTFIFGSALTSSADEYYYYDYHGHPERHQYRDNGFRINFIRPSDPFDDDDIVEFKLDIL